MRHRGNLRASVPGTKKHKDRFYVGTLKGMMRIYQQTFVGTYSKVDFRRLYDPKTPVAAADLFNDQLLPFLKSTRYTPE